MRYTKPGKIFFIIITCLLNNFSVFAFDVYELSKYVDLFAGVTNNVSNCVIGPVMPFSLIHPSPDTHKDVINGGTLIIINE